MRTIYSVLATAIIAVGLALPATQPVESAQGTCICMMPHVGKATGREPGKCHSRDPKYDQLCGTETDSSSAWLALDPATSGVGADPEAWIALRRLPAADPCAVLLANVQLQHG